MPARITVEDLLQRYDGFLVDAYGVLVDSSGPRPGAREFIASLNARGHDWLIVTNDASRLPETIATRLSGFGMDVPEHRILSSGQLLTQHADPLADPVVWDSFAAAVEFAQQLYHQFSN